MSLFGITLFLAFQSVNITSPNGNYEVSIKTRALNDMQTHREYHLIDNGAGDSRFLMNEITHDLHPSVLWWTLDSRYLIYEHRNDTDIPQTVNIYSITRDSVILSVSGFINTRQHNEDRFFDKKGKLLLYFRKNKKNKYSLMMLDLVKMKTTKVMPFEHYDVYESPVITTFNKGTGQIELSVKNKYHNNTTVKAQL